MQNIGTPDRIIRIILGLALIAAPLSGLFAFYALPAAFWISMAAGVILIATSLISWCPLYTALSFNTLGRKG